MFVECILDFLLQPTEALNRVQQELGYQKPSDDTVTVGLQIRIGGMCGSLLSSDEALTVNR